jgi:tRNA(Ile)-lysidine synthase
MNLIQHITQWVDHHHLIRENQTIIIGLSGGPDSVFLLHYLKIRQQELNLHLIAAHLDHQWRATSAKDEQFCRELCQKMEVPFESATMSNLGYSFKESGSKEQDARKARRYFFESLATKYGAHTIALAQHKDDQQETFFIRLLRGSTVTGLASIWPEHGIYIRPLLSIGKAEILDWLEKHNIAYVIDETNVNLDYLRNRIRHELIPTIMSIDHRADKNITKTILHLQSTELFLEKLTTELFSTVAHYDDTEKRYVLDSKLFLSQDQFLQYRLLIHWLTVEAVDLPASKSFLDEIIRFLKQPAGKDHAIHHNWHIIKRKQLCFIRNVD